MQNVLSTCTTANSLKSVNYVLRTQDKQWNRHEQEQKRNLCSRGNNMLRARHPSAPRMSQTAIFWILHVKHHRGKTFLMTTNPPGEDTSWTALKIYPCLLIMTPQQNATNRQVRLICLMCFCTVKTSSNTNPESRTTIFWGTSGKCEQSIWALMFDWNVIGLFHRQPRLKLDLVSCKASYRRHTLPDSVQNLNL